MNEEFVRPDVRAFLDHLDSRAGPKTHEVDPETARQALGAGATALVAGTAAFRGGPAHYADNIKALRGET